MAIKPPTPQAPPLKLEVQDTSCGACFEPVLHGPEQCIVMQMYVTAAGE